MSGTNEKNEYDEMDEQDRAECDSLRIADILCLIEELEAETDDRETSVPEETNWPAPLRTREARVVDIDRRVEKLDRQP